MSSIWDVAGWLVAVPLAVWLLKLAEGWYRWSEGFRVCSRPESHRREMAEIQQQINEAQRQLEYYRSTPNWFDIEWKICDDLLVSPDGEYCVHCYRQPGDHLVQVGP